MEKVTKVTSAMVAATLLMGTGVAGAWADDSTTSNGVPPTSVTTIAPPAKVKEVPQKEYDEAKQRYERLKEEVEKLLAEVEAHNQKVDELYEEALEGYRKEKLAVEEFNADIDKQIKAIEEANSAKKKQYEALLKEYNEAKTQSQEEYNRKLAEYKTAKAEYDKAKSAYTAEKAKYDKAVQDQAEANRVAREKFDQDHRAWEERVRTLNSEHSKKMEKYRTDLDEWTTNNQGIAERNKVKTDAYDRALAEFNRNNQGLPEVQDGKVEIQFGEKQPHDTTNTFYERTKVVGAAPVGTEIVTLREPIAWRNGRATRDRNVNHIDVGQSLTYSDVATTTTGKKLDLKVTVNSGANVLLLHPLDSASDNTVVPFSYSADSENLRSFTLDMSFDFYVEGKPVTVMTGGRVTDVDLNQGSLTEFVGAHSFTNNKLPEGTELTKKQMPRLPDGKMGYFGSAEGRDETELKASYFTAGYGTGLKYYHSSDSSAIFAIFGPYSSTNTVVARPTKPVLEPVAPKPTEPTAPTLPEEPVFTPATGNLVEPTFTLTEPVEPMTAWNREEPKEPGYEPTDGLVKKELPKEPTMGRKMIYPQEKLDELAQAKADLDGMKVKPVEKPAPAKQTPRKLAETGSTTWTVLSMMGIVGLAGIALLVGANRLQRPTMGTERQ